jgi:hypothetical protein
VRLSPGDFVRLVIHDGLGKSKRSSVWMGVVVSYVPCLPNAFDKTGDVRLLDCRGELRDLILFIDDDVEVVQSYEG